MRIRHKEIEKRYQEERAALLQSINTKEDFQQSLMPVVETMNAGPRLHVPSYKKVQSILLRGQQILEPDAFWDVLDSVGIGRQDALELINDEIRQGTAQAVNAPYFDYMDEIAARIRKLSREMKAGKHNQEIFKLKFQALFTEFLAMAAAWDRQQPGRPEGAPSTIELFTPMFQRLASWAE